MDMSTLGKTGPAVSKIGLGTVQFGLDYGFTKKKTQDEVDEILDFAYKNGINFIDTARSYGDSEGKIGNFVSQNPCRFVIATKLEKITAEDAADTGKLKSGIFRSIEKSLESLKLDRLDIIQLHQTEDFLIKNYNFWKTILAARSEGMFSFLGVSVYEEAETRYIIENLSRYIDFFQIPYNIFDRRFDRLEDPFTSNGMGVVGRSVFLKGVITCDEEALPPELEPLKKYKRMLGALAASMSIGVYDAALLYVYSKEFVDSIIIGVDSVSELKKNIKAIGSKHLISNIAAFDDIRIDDKNLIDPRSWVNL